MRYNHVLGIVRALVRLHHRTVLPRAHHGIESRGCHPSLHWGKAKAGSGASQGMPAVQDSWKFRCVVSQHGVENRQAADFDEPSWRGLPP